MKRWWVAGWLLLPVGAWAGESFERQRGTFQYINPLLDCVADDTQFKLLAPFRYKLEQFIQTELRGQASHVSIYFRDLNNGPWIGINEKERFTPASLLKVPIMIAYFKWAEEKPGVLEKRVKFEGRPDVSAEPLIRSSHTVQEGVYYTADELVRRMIVHSDNVALALLARNIPPGIVEETYRDFGLETPSDDQEDFLTVKDYASFFRVLFNASYLNRRSSEKALGALAKTEFERGLRAGVPEGVPVAHKFGERRIGGGREQVFQMHDCGIVYYPNHPYLLCVMTRGRDVEQLVDAIRRVSGLVYAEVDAQMKQ